MTPADHNESFILKIAQNLKIKKSLAKEYYAEYLRFIYLAAISETPITPSKAIDKIWHLHLQYTRSYWDDLCDGIIGKRIHHDPGSLVDNENEYFKIQFRQTISQYHLYFTSFLRHDAWFKKDAWWKAIWNPLYGLYLVLIFLATPYASSDNEGSSDFIFPIFIFLFIFILVKIFKGGGKNGGGHSGCSHDSSCGSSCGGGCGGGD